MREHLWLQLSTKLYKNHPNSQRVHHQIMTKAKLTFSIAFYLMLLGFVLSPVNAQSSPFFEDGDYQVGVRAMLLTDESRDDRKLQAYIWYPAQIAEGANPPFPADNTRAPYPLIIYSHGYGASTTEAVGDIQHLVSQGFVVAGVDHHDPTSDKWLAFINRPLDILFLLNQITALKDDDPLAGIVDTNNVGIWGGSMGAYTAVAVSGARVDPNHFQEWCPTYEDDPNFSLNFDSCKLLTDWDKLLAYHEQYNEASNEDLWAATTDERIHAVLGTATCFEQMFGEAGLAAISIPIFIIAGTADHTCPYDIDAVYLYDHVSSSDRYLVSLQDRDHAGSFAEPGLTLHYASAFFGYYLRSQTDYAQYMLPESAEAFNDVTLELQLSEP